MGEVKLPDESFNLITEPWLTVSRDSELVQVGLQEVLLHAHEFTRLEDPSPLVQGALHRLLLAVLHRALAGPKDVAEARNLLDTGRFSEGVISAYLKRYRARFNLFDVQRPFYQVAGFELPAAKLAPITRLIAEAATGNNATLSDHSVDTDVKPRNTAEVARLLVVHQTFALGGGRSALGYTSHAPVAGAALTLALGETLFETLVLNLVPYEPEGDAPLWERPPLTKADIQEGRPPDGLTDRYTWPSRALRLVPRTGRDGLAVSHLAYAAGLTASWSDDPMVAYREVEKVGTLPFSLRQDRAVWRDFRALVPTPGSAFTPPAVIEHAAALGRPKPVQNVMVLGLVSDQAKVFSWRAEVYSLPKRLLDDEALRQQLDHLLETADALGRELWSTQWRVTEGLQSPKGGADRKVVTRLAASLPLTRSYWSQAEMAFGELLDRLAHTSEVEVWWRERLTVIALEAWEETVRAVGLTPRALRALQAGECTVRYALRTATQPQEEAT